MNIFNSPLRRGAPLFILAALFTGISASCPAMPAVPGTPGAAGPDLVYRAEDLEFRPERAARVIGDADVEAMLAKLLGDKAFLLPLLQLDRADRREKLRNVLQIAETVKALDLGNLDAIENVLRVDALTDVWRGIQGLRGKAVSESQLEGLRRAVETYGTLADLARRFGNTPKRGRYAFLLATAREELARRIKDPEKVRLLKQLIREDLLEALASLGSKPAGESGEKPDEEPLPATREDIEEKLKTLDEEFGGISPLRAPGGKGVTTTSAMGMRRHPKTGRMRYHSGIDLAGAGCDGWKVAAIGPGRVVSSGWNGGYGYMVVLRHDLDAGLVYSRYGHLRREGRLPPGTVVGRGDPIGLCNNTGVSTGPHLHFEIRRHAESGRPVDPRPFLSESADALLAD
ncbi:MAG TPA: M23 family metallopeptidase [Candidatus Ozemobacteraceae bacterium]|nr:M23 family metallopeptidase [Candidatus Ozemobacteraceae bacterium]